MVETGRKPDTNHRRTIRVVFINENNEVLLLKKSGNSQAPGLFEVPGGGIEKSDRSIIKGWIIKNAAIRESREETGLRIKRRKIRIIGGFDYSFQGKHGITKERKVDVVVVKVKGKPQVIVTEANDNKHVSARWVPLEEMRTMDGELSGNTKPIPAMLDFACV